MDKDIKVTLKVWRQKGPKDKGQFETYQIDKINQSVSFLEMLDILNERLVSEGKEPIVFQRYRLPAALPRSPRPCPPDNQCSPHRRPWQ